MRKIKFNVDNIYEMDSFLIDSLKNDKRVINFLNENKLDLSTINKYPNKFNDWITQLDECDKCNGLKYCVQPNKGKVFDLKYDDIFSNTLILCKYSIEDTEKKKHLNNFYINDLSENMKYVNFTDINFDNEESKYLDSLSKVFDCLETRDYGLFIYGSIGSGKTFLSACAANKLSKDGYKVSFVNLPLFSQRIKTQFEDNEYQRELNKIINSDFVVIDDIGAESVTSWFRDEILFNILNERMENKRWTWFTSNEDFTSLKHHFEINNRNVSEKIKAERIMARIKSLSKPLEIIGKDRRIV